MTRKIGRTTTADGTELELRERDDGNFTIVDRDTGEIVEEPSRQRGRQGAREDLQQTAQFMDQGRRSQQPDRQQGSWGSEMSFGADRGRSDDGLFGGGLGGGFGFGGGGSTARRERDQNSGRFTSTRREPADFEMERDAGGKFSGRASDDDRDSGGLFGGLGSTDEQFGGDFANAVDEATYGDSSSTTRAEGGFLSSPPELTEGDDPFLVGNPGEFNSPYKSKDKDKYD